MAGGAAWRMLWVLESKEVVMSTHVSEPMVSPGARRSSTFLRSSAFAAGLAIASMWIAVLFIGLFAGDIVNHSAGGDASTVPAVVPVALFALIGTWIVARRGFSGPPAE